MKKAPFVFVRDIELVGGDIIKKGTVAKLSQPRNEWAVGVTEYGRKFMVDRDDVERAS